ncbi:hypothetical protein ACN42_g10144 [Penicillium freii]|uniref:Uncharacterized protein n=1 Tax=Penicillium freii TaxID=48697 RepID=A0A101MAQ4_PENFR|nr:hypothetical protein ACN42_g10144 [Penicillium freii]
MDRYDNGTIQNYIHCLIIDVRTDWKTTDFVILQAPPCHMPVEKQAGCRCCALFWNHAAQMERQDTMHWMHFVG